MKARFLSVALLCLSPVVLAEDCPMVPRPKEYHASGDTLVLGTAETAAIVVGRDASEPELYAAGRLQTHIERRFKRTLPILEHDKLTGAVRQVYEFSGAPLRDLPFNGFSVVFEKREDVDWITIRGADKGGLIYGGEAFFDLIKKDADGIARVTVATVKDWPSIPWRGRPHSVMAQQIQPGQLDAYVHARINFSDFRDNPTQPATLTMDARKSSMGCPPGKPIDTELFQRVFREYKKRAFFVYGTVSCRLDADDYSQLTETFDELLELGCDGIWVSMDDTGGGADPVRLAQYASDYMQKTGMTGIHMMFTPGGAEYSTIDRPLNWAMAKIEPFNTGSWIFTRVPCKADYELCQKMGLKSKPAWWYNYCETSYPDPKAGFIHSSAILTTQRKDGKPSYMNLLPITPGWGSPEFDKLRDADLYTDRINLWALCGGWPAEYALGMFGQWGWNPKDCDWPKLRDSIYDYVWGPSQVATIREFDETWVQLKQLYWLPDRWGFRAPGNTLVRLKTPQDRPKALGLLDKLDKLAAVLADGSPDETAIGRERLVYQYLEPIQVSLRFARKQATLEYPEYEYADFEFRALQIQVEQNADAANAYLSEVQAKIPPMLARLSKELDELKDIEPVLDLWRARLAKSKTVAAIESTQLQEKLAQWKTFVNQPIKDFLPFLDEPSEGDLAALFKNRARPVPAGTLKTYDAADWTCHPAMARGAYCVGFYERDGQQAAAILLPINTRSTPGDFGYVELNVPKPELEGRLFAELFLVDTRLDRRYHNVRRIEVLANGKTLFTRDIADPKADDWVTMDLTDAVANATNIKLQVRVIEQRAVSNHTSWVFVGPVRLYQR